MVAAATEEGVVTEVVEVAEEKVLGEEVVVEEVVLLVLQGDLDTHHILPQPMIPDPGHLMLAVLLIDIQGEQEMNLIIVIPRRLEVILQEIMAVHCLLNPQGNVQDLIHLQATWPQEDLMRGVSLVNIHRGGATTKKEEPLHQLGGI